MLLHACFSVQSAVVLRMQSAAVLRKQIAVLWGRGVCVGSWVGGAGVWGCVGLEGGVLWCGGTQRVQIRLWAVACAGMLWCGGAQRIQIRT